MKKLLFLGFATILFASCNQEVRYTQNSPEIDSYKKVIEDYKNLNWQDMATHYSDTAKVMNNVTDVKAKMFTEALKVMQDDATHFSWVIEKEEYEMVVTDKKETWVNFYGIWKGTMKTTKKMYEIPIHVTARFIDGKIVEEYGYWNNAEIVTDMLKTPETPTPTTEM
jgi:hypothetical protein